MLGATLAVEAGYDLRSRCVLRSTDAITWQLLGKPGEVDKSFALDKAPAPRMLARLPGIAHVHPLQPDETVQGALRIMYELQQLLASITGFAAALVVPPIKS